jgi:hypothetical protein
MSQGYRDVLEACPKDAQESARYLTQWVFRNHVETQALAIAGSLTARRIPIPCRSAACWLTQLLTPTSLASLRTRLRPTQTLLPMPPPRHGRFANKVVAHLDRDHSAATRDVDVGDLDTAVD